MPKIEIATAPTRLGSGYPQPYDQQCAGRRRWALGDAAGLSQFGVNLLRLPPQQWSSQRHWHSAEDEFVYVLEGEVVLYTNAGAQVMKAGDCAGFPAGLADGHHLQNRSDCEAVILEIGARNPENDPAAYPDIDLMLGNRSDGYRHKDGTPY